MWGLGASMMVLLSLQNLAVQGKEPDLFITHPKTVIKGKEFPVDFVFDSPPAGSETLIATFLGVSEPVIRKADPSFARVMFMVDANERTREGHVTINNTNTGVQLLTSEKIEIRGLSSTTIIQTDKGKYKPGQFVLFRVLNVDSDLKPLQNNITIIVKDPANNTVYEKKSDATASELGGIIEGNCSLIDDAPLGQYKIVVYGLTRKEAVFTVEKYTLPKFETILTLDVASVALVPGMKSIPIIGEVKAVYTYGQFVAGTMNLKVNGQTKLTVPKFDGFKTFNITLDDEEYLNSRSKQILRIQAVVEEGITGNSANANSSLTVFPVQFAALPVEPISDYSVNDPLYVFQVSLVDAVDGSLINDDISAYTLYYEYYQNFQTFTDSKPVESNPVFVVIDVDQQTDLSNNRLKVWFVHEPSELQSEKVPVEVSKLVSYSDNYISVVLEDSDQDNQACFSIENANSKTFYQVVGNGYQSEMEAYDAFESKQCFMLTQEHAPMYEVIGYQIHDDEITESYEILVNRVVGTHSVVIQRQVSMLVRPGTVKPGESVLIDIETSAPGNSFIGLRAVDKSSLLLQRGLDVSQAKVDGLRIIDRMFNNDIDRDAPDYPIEPMPFFWRRPYESSISPGSIIQDAGLSLSATKMLQFFTCTYCGGGDITAGGAEQLPNVVQDEDAGNRVTSVAEVEPEIDDETRKDFPETWIWALKQISSGTTQIRETVPDTITNWVIDVFSLNPTSGLEVIPTQELTVTKPLFISMNLPYSIIRGEQFTLQILVFNYNSEEVNVNVVLKSSTEFLVPNGAPLSGTFSIGAKSNGVLEVPIKATTIGEVKLEATAEQVLNSTNSDSVERMLLVEPEGRPLVNSTLLQVNSSQSSVSQTFNINLMDLVGDKETFVDGSLRAYVQVTGDVMGSYVNGLESKFRMPSGCGEQNIISMTPGLFVGKYLKAYNKLILDIKVKVEKACQSGYKRELNYKHSDGSYSAFGEGNGAVGSTWLTAYVLKIFSILGEERFADRILNPDILEQAFDFISRNEKRRKDDEYFDELGKVIHKDMQQGGGARNPHAFSAYILISIQDYHQYLVSKGYNTQTVGDLVGRVSRWLYGKIGSILTDFSRTLISYTLARSGAILNNQTYITAAEDLMDSFELTETPNKETPMAKRGRVSKPVSLDVERNGYALLTYVTLYNTITMKKMQFKEKAQAILNWLTQKRGPDGFFSSTQDTAVGLQAIAEYAILFPEDGSIDFSVQVGQNSDPMIVNENNYYITQQQQVDVSQLNSNNLNVQVSGSNGQLLVTVLTYFNTESNVTGTSLNVSVENRIPPGKIIPYLRISVNELTGEGLLPTSPMVVCQMELPSGMIVDEIESVTGSLPLSRTELSEDGKTLAAYIMNDQGQLKTTGAKFDVKYSKVFDIENPAPGKMTVYDYYEIGNSVDLMYKSANQAPIVDPDEPTTGAAGMTVNLILICLTSLVIILQKSFF